MIDEIVLKLEVCSNLLDEYVVAISVSTNLRNMYRELQVVIGQLLVLWQTRLLRLENRSVQAPGRPKIGVGVEMVRFSLKTGHYPPSLY